MNKLALFLWETHLAQLQNYFFYRIYLSVVGNVDNNNKLPSFPQFTPMGVSLGVIICSFLLACKHFTLLSVLK